MIGKVLMKTSEKNVTWQRKMKMIRNRAIFVTVVLLMTRADVGFAQFRFEPVMHSRGGNLVFAQSNDVGGRISKIVAEQLNSSSDVDPATTLESLGADELDMVEIMLKFETEFGITIPDEEAEKVKTVADATRLVEKLSAAKQ
jgi:acyl carrier protein